MNASKIRLLCVEDDPLVRTYLKIRLELEPDIAVMGVVGSAGEARAFLRNEDVDVLLLDQDLGGTDGLQFLDRLVHPSLPEAQRPVPRVLFCTGLATADFEEAARLHGACGVVPKHRIALELLPALHAVADGKEWFDHGCARWSAAS
jgi:DNA-binding NarL/FixJ family response regulator